MSSSVQEKKRKNKTQVTLNAIQLSVHFIIIMIQSFLYIYCLRKHEKQCRQNFAVVIFIYGGSMTAKAECRHKFRGLGMVCDGCNYFSFRPFFALSPPSQPKKSKFKKIEKKPLEILSFYTSVPKTMIICYTVPEIWHETDVIVIFHFGLLPFYLPNSPKNQN